MKRTLLALFVSFVAILFIKWDIPVVHTKKHFMFHPKKDDPDAPSEYFFLERTFPDSVFDYKAYSKVMQEVALNKKQLTRGANYNAPWTLEGPVNLGGRFNTMAVQSDDPQIMYAACATGGVFKTNNGGITWNPIFDAQPFISIGAITIDPKDDNKIYVGTGDANITGYPFIGNGIYRSNDGGQSWKNLGLIDESIISKIIVDPVDTSIIYAATMGIPFVQDTNRGLYKSTNGGLTWNNILFLGDSAGVIDLEMSTANHNLLYAVGFNRYMGVNFSIVCGNKAHIYRSSDGGATWDTLKNGLPSGIYGRPSLSLCNSYPNVLFATYCDTSSQLLGVYKTSDSGNTWSSLYPYGLESDAFNGQGWYSGGIKVNPTDSNDVWLCGVNIYHSTDGANTWSLGAPEWYTYVVHADHHDVLFNDGNIYDCTDGGIYETTDEGADWSSIESIPNNQFYHVVAHPFNIGLYVGGVQDNGTTSGNAANLNNWQRNYGGDGFKTVYDLQNSYHFFYELEYGAIEETQDGGNTFNDITQMGGVDPSDRRNWDLPYFISKYDNSVVYFGTDKVYFYSEDSFINTPVSNDLTGGDIYGPYYNTISALCESQTEKGNLYVGTSDAKVWHTPDGGQTWENITDNLPVRHINSIASSCLTKGRIYVAQSGYRSDDFIPHVHRSDDYGNTWTDISGDLPQFAVNSILPFYQNDDIIFAATDAGVYVTVNAGANWSRLGNNMPIVSVFDVEIDSFGRKLIAGTYGRSMMSYPLDSILNRISTSIPQVQVTSLNIYPLPATDNIFVNSLQTSFPLTLQLYDMNGKEVLEQKLDNPQTVDVSQLSSGLYIARLENSSNMWFKKVIKLQ